MTGQPRERQFEEMELCLWDQPSFCGLYWCVVYNYIKIDFIATFKKHQEKNERDRQRAISQL